MRLGSRELSHGVLTGCACALALTGALVLSGCGVSGGAAGGQAQGATAEEVAEEPAAEPLSTEEIDSWLSGEDGFTGRPVTLVGQVFNVRREDGATMLQVHTDLENYTDNVVVLCEGANPKIGSQAYVEVSGVVGDDVEYENAFGTQMSAVAVKADSIEKLAYKDAVAPTTTSLSPAAVNEQKNYKLTVDTIEFSDKETRIYLTVTNGGVGRFNLHTTSAAVVQDGIQQNVTTPDYQADYPTFSNSIIPGASMSGVLTFPPLKVSSFELWLQGSSDNYQADGGSIDFNFKFNIK